MILSFSGRPGSGKTAIIRALKEAHPSWLYPNRVVTREPRDSDSDAEYSYVSEEEFGVLCEQGDLFLPVSIHGYRVSFTKDSIDALCRKEYVGLLQLVPDSVPDFIEYVQENITPIYMLSSEEEIRERLVKRDGDLSYIESKLEETRDWDKEARASNIPYIFINNDKGIGSVLKKLTDSLSDKGIILPVWENT